MPRRCALGTARQNANVRRLAYPVAMTSDSTDPALPTNDPVAQAIEALTRSPNEANRARFYRSLRQGALYLALRESIGFSDMELLGVKGDMRVLRTVRGTDVAYLAVSMPDGKKALAAFTDPDSLLKRVPAGHGMCLTTTEVLEKVIAENFDGLIVNPAGPWAGAPREDVEYLLQGVWDAENVPDA